MPSGVRGIEGIRNLDAQGENCFHVQWTTVADAGASA
jgi:hypothetical protein